ncbi:GTP-binding protein RAD [Galendromus occidentalis]|uniref:GTP-binding protein RAD n=1 Tax=Galendromus occidentalis TaxID=34638 RepID=A0AAJ6QRS7_9ACAR|nr:GTP-binding protein RAD [Galendromus occidentalis]
MYVDFSVTPVIEPKKRHSEPYTEYSVCQSLCVPKNDSMHCLSVPDLSTSPHQLFKEFCSDTPRATSNNLSPPSRSPVSSASASPNRISRNRNKQTKGRRRSLGVPGSRSPNGRNLWKELDEDPWAEFHRKRSPGAVSSPKSHLEPPSGYRCRSFSITSRGNILNLGDVVLSNLEERRRSTSSCTEDPEDTGPPLFRVRLIGSQGVGKSCLIRQFIEGCTDTVNEDGHLEIITSPPSSARNSVDTQSTRVMLDGEEFEVEFDETTDNVITKQHIEEIDAFVVVYSITDRESWNFAEDAICELRTLCGYSKGRRRSSATNTTLSRPITKTIFLAANKADLARRRCVSNEEAKAFAKKHDLKFMEMSACIGHNVDDVLVKILKQLRLKQRSGSVPAWCNLNVPIRSRAASLSPDPTGHRASITAFSPITVRRPSVARSICYKARGFISKFWTKCDSLKTHSYDDLHVL